MIPPIPYFLRVLGCLRSLPTHRFTRLGGIYKSPRKLSKYKSVGVGFKCFFPIINAKMAKMRDCCKDKRGKCVRNGKVFTLPRRFSMKRCMQGVRGFSMRSSCAPYVGCKKRTKRNKEGRTKTNKVGRTKTNKEGRTKRNKVGRTKTNKEGRTKKR